MNTRYIAYNVLRYGTGALTAATGLSAAIIGLGMYQGRQARSGLEAQLASHQANAIEQTANPIEYNKRTSDLTSKIEDNKQWDDKFYHAGLFYAVIASAGALGLSQMSRRQVMPDGSTLIILTERESKKMQQWRKEQGIEELEIVDETEEQK